MKVGSISPLMVTDLLIKYGSDKNKASLYDRGDPNSMFSSFAISTRIYDCRAKLTKI